MIIVIESNVTSLAHVIPSHHVAGCHHPQLVEERNIEVNLRRNLVEVRGQSNEAVFEHLDEPGKTTVSKVMNVILSSIMCSKIF